MIELELTRGEVALVDDADVAKVIDSFWFVVPSGKTQYAQRAYRRDGGRVASQTMHRLIMDAPRGAVVHHINGNGLDNRRENLEVRTYAENASRFGAEAVAKRRAQMLMLAVEIDERQGYVTLRDIAASVGVSKKTARKYVDLLLEGGEWVKLPSAALGKRPLGRPPLRIHQALP